MKQCNICKEYKELSHFSKKKAGLQSACKVCHAAYRKNHYQKNKDKVIKQVAERNKGYRELAYNYILDYLLEHPCVDCGENDPIVLEFDHVRGEKITEVSRIPHLGQSNLKMLIDEIAKCDVRCRNCHLKRHAIADNHTIVKLINKRAALM